MGTMIAVSVSHRTGASMADPRGADVSTPGSPPAARRTDSRWADPRLWVGVLLVLASVLVGAKVLGAADDTVAVWRVQRDVPAGFPLSSADVVLTRVHFADGSARDSYLSADEALPSGARLTRELSAGELLAVQAITTDTSAAPDELPIAVNDAGLPVGLSPGDRVDVWAVAASDRTTTEPVQVLQDVAVTAVSGAGPGGLGVDREILVALSDGTDVAQVLAELNGASVVLIQNGT